MASISAFEPRIHKGLHLKKKRKTVTLSFIVQSCFLSQDRMLDLPIVDIAKEECTKINVEQLASTRATSAMQIALAVSDSPGHPYPCTIEWENINKMCMWMRPDIRKQSTNCLVCTFVVPPAKPRVARLGMA